jgi:hypothetical protein
MQFDAEKVRANARAASLEDLLDRVTVYRQGMEPAALPILEQELRSRGVSREQIDAHAARREQEVLLGPDGWALPCSFCERPAVTQGWGWHRLWGLLPVFPRPFRYCAEHRPEAGPGGAQEHDPAV